MSNLTRVNLSVLLIIASVPVTLMTAGTLLTLIVPVMLFVAWQIMKGIN